MMIRGIYDFFLMTHTVCIGGIYIYLQGLKTGERERGGTVTGR